MLSYSTTEHKTGRKWIDGKPTYEKTVDCGALPNSTTKTVNHNITNLDFVIKCRGTAIGGNNRVLIPNPSISSAGVIEIYANETQIVIQTGNDRSAYSGYVTLEYTKNN